ncbi:hypothetical protein ACFL13_02020 [Patescibacteria group bacterium]
MRKFLFLALLVGIVFPAYAQGIEVTPCEAKKNTLQNRIDYFTQKQADHKQTFQNLQNHLNQIVEIAQTEGYDTKHLEGNSTGLKQKIQDFVTSSDKLIAQLKALGGNVCTLGELEMINTHKVTKEKLSSTRDTISEIKVFVNEIVIPNVLNLEKIPNE